MQEHVNLFFCETAKNVFKFFLPQTCAQNNHFGFKWNVFDVDV